MAIRLVTDGREYVREPGDRLETDLGVLEIPETVTPGDELDTHLGHTFNVRALRPPDWFTHFERTGAPIIPRDIGLIIGETGVGMGDQVLDVGTGTGVLAAALAHAGATVVTFERDEDAAETARENMRLASVNDRVDVRTADATAVFGTAELGTFDVVTLDTPDATTLVDLSESHLAEGGFLAVYSPFVESARSVVGAARSQYAEVNCIETIQRSLDVDPRGTRPSTRPVGHTGYLTFARRQ